MKQVFLFLIASSWLYLVLGISISWNTFNPSNLAQFQLNGDAANYNPSPDNALVICPAIGGDDGSAFYNTPLPLVGEDGTSFSTSFSFRITDSGGVGDEDGPGADGFTFVITTETDLVGGTGEGLGYEGIQHSVAVEFDTYNNGAQDAFNGNHVGIDLNGDLASVILEPYPIRFNDGGVHYAWVDYDHSSMLLEVRVSESNVRPDDAYLSYTVDITNQLGQRGAPSFIGFTAGTGGGWGNHEILSWYFSNTFQPTEVVGLCPLATPVQCPDGTCVDSAINCPIILNPCTPVCPYQCVTGNCVCSPLECTSRKRVTCRYVTCWDASCATTQANCPALPKCPVGYIRCYNGSCAPPNATCPTNQCPPPQVQCPQGNCANSSSQCQPYNGCSDPTPIQCADGSCASNLTQCVCANQSLYRCSDGTCQITCPNATSDQKPLQTTTTVDTTNSTNVTIVGGNDRQPIGNVTVTGGSGGSSNGSNVTSITVSPVADSTTGSINNTDVASGGSATSSATSPVVQVDSSGTVNATISLVSTVNTTGNGTRKRDDFIPIINCLAYAADENGVWTCQSEVTFSVNGDGQTVASASTNHLNSIFTVLPMFNHELSLSVNPSTTSSCDTPVPTSADDPVASGVCRHGINEPFLAGVTSTPGSCADDWSETRKWAATDGCNDITFASRTIFYSDQTPPSFVVPSDQTFECGTSFSTVPSVTGNAVPTDNCDPSPSISHSDSTSPSVCFPGTGQITRTWTATDRCGNQASADQFINIVDTTPPSITTYSGCMFPPNEIRHCYSQSDLVGPITDTCSNDPSLAGPGFCSTSGFFYDPVHNQYCVQAVQGADYPISFIARDDCGNEALSISHITSPSHNENCAVFTSCDTAITGVSSSVARITTIDAYGYDNTPQYRAVVEIVVAEAVLTNWRLELHFPDGDQIVRYSQYDVYEDAAFSCETTERNIAVLLPQPWAYTHNQGETITIEYVATNNGEMHPDEILTITKLFVWTTN